LANLGAREKFERAGVLRDLLDMEEFLVNSLRASADRPSADALDREHNADGADKRLDPESVKLDAKAKLAEAAKIEKKDPVRAGNLRDSANRPPKAPKKPRELRDAADKAEEQLEKHEKSVRETGEPALVAILPNGALATQPTKKKRETAEAIDQLRKDRRRKQGYDDEEFLGRLLASANDKLVAPKRRGPQTAKLEIEREIEELSKVDHSGDPVVEVFISGVWRARLLEGQLLGEMSCLDREPRNATVKVTRDCYVVEMLSNILLQLKRTKFKEHLDEAYRDRALSEQLLKLKFFSGLKDKEIARLKDEIQFREKSRGDVIIEQGKPPEGLFIIRSGIVRVFMRDAAGAERTIAYRGQGSPLGEISLLSQGEATATCEAVSHPAVSGKAAGNVELLFLSPESFTKLCGEIPALKTAAQNFQKSHEEHDRRLKNLPAQPKTLGPDYGDMGLYQGQKLMLIDLDKCTRCDECVRACASTHEGKSRLRLEPTRLFREGPRFGKYLVPSTCRLCVDPVCMIGCPVGSIHKAPLGHIVIEDWCVGCEICATNCPYGSINMHDLPAPLGVERDPLNRIKDVVQQAVVCDQCNTLTGEEPKCVYACPHDAAMRVEAREFFAEQAGISAIDPFTGVRS
ncbi:MAG: cyclic nucleotide-binding domain-containing protein, partial [Planctomycetota bacterium]|nr:cyclic nucleotide-binding domain-containing protein [Planctomycetota bacterium]